MIVDMPPPGIVSVAGLPSAVIVAVVCSFV